MQRTSVTPFFQHSILSRPNGIFLIDGYVGVIDREFEEAWIAPRITTEHNTYCLALNIANIDEIRQVQWIQTGDGDRKLAQFCEAVVSYLERLPHNRALLKKELVEIDLPRSLMKPFTNYGQAQKIDRLKNFLCSEQNRYLQ